MAETRGRRGTPTVLDREVFAQRWARALAAARERYEREKRRHARKARRADPAVARAAAMHSAYGRRRR